jgi:hypothetical protein
MPVVAAWRCSLTLACNCSGSSTLQNVRILVCHTRVCLSLHYRVVMCACHRALYQCACAESTHDCLAVLPVVPQPWCLPEGSAVVTYYWSPAEYLLICVAGQRVHVTVCRVLHRLKRLRRAILCSCRGFGDNKPLLRAGAFDHRYMEVW